MARLLALTGLSLGLLALAWGIWLLINPPEMGPAFGVGLVIFGPDRALLWRLGSAHRPALNRS